MAVGQIPSGKLAERFGGVRVLALGTTLIAVGYCLAGFTGSLYGVIAGLLLAGLGGSTQHPIASSLVAAAYHGPRSRTALGTYNFSGDVGKVLLPALFALVAASLGWQQAMVVIATLAVVGASIILASLKPIVTHGTAEPSKAVAGRTGHGPTGCCSRSTSPTTWYAPASSFSCRFSSGTKAPTCRPSASACRCCSPAVLPASW